MDDNSSKGKFALRLPVTTRQVASELARKEGISLNQFITIAIAEKIVRLELTIDGDRTEPAERISRETLPGLPGRPN